jgi:hypothetical protein
MPTSTRRPARSRSRRRRTSSAATLLSQAALQVHATLLGFHETEQATKFRQVVRERYPADAELIAALIARSRPGSPEGTAT